VSSSWGEDHHVPFNLHENAEELIVCIFIKGICSPLGVHFLRAQKTNQKRAPNIACSPKYNLICGVVENSLRSKICLEHILSAKQPAG